MEAVPAALKLSLGLAPARLLAKARAVTGLPQALQTQRTPMMVAMTAPDTPLWRPAATQVRSHAFKLLENHTPPDVIYFLKPQFRLCMLDERLQSLAGRDICHISKASTVFLGYASLYTFRDGALPPCRARDLAFPSPG